MVRRHHFVSRIPPPLALAERRPHPSNAYWLGKLTNYRQFLHQGKRRFPRFLPSKQPLGTQKLNLG